MSDRIGEEYDAVICSVTSFGFFARTENLCEGLVRAETLGGNFVFNERNYTLSSGRRAYKLGDRVRVRVASADIITGKISFELCGVKKEDYEKSEKKNARKKGYAKKAHKKSKYPRKRRR